MNWENLYYKICKKAKEEKRVKSHNEYYEAHHIYPKSIFPELEKDDNNIVLLTAREHFFCHQLLTKIYNSGENHSKMVYALWILSNRFSIKTGKQYSRLREEYIKLLNTNENNIKTRFQKGQKPVNKGKPMSDEQKKKLSSALKGKPSYRKGNKYPNSVSKKTKEKISNKLKGIKKSDSTKEKMSNARRSTVLRKQNFKILLVNTGEVFDCLKDARDKYPQGGTHICDCLSGRRSYAGLLNGEKMIWQKINK